MAAISTLSSAIDALSISSSDLSVPSLTRLPTEISVGIAEFLDHKSLVHLSATCSPLRQLMLNQVDFHWKSLHDKQWSCGKRLRFNGPPSQRPRSVVAAVDEDVTWREEFIRRIMLDKSVPALLVGIADEVYAAVMNHGADIFDKLKDLCEEPEYSNDALSMMLSINIAECVDDWDALLGLPTDNTNVEDGAMIISKLFQSKHDLIHRSSPDKIYDEMTLALVTLRPEDLDGFEVVETNREDDVVDLVRLDKVILKRRGPELMLRIINHRVRGTPLPDGLTKENFWQLLKYTATTLSLFGGDMQHKALGVALAMTFSNPQDNLE